VADNTAPGSKTRKDSGGEHCIDFRLQARYCVN
jgi:hypothetical protein